MNSLESLKDAIAQLHRFYRIPHIIVTSVRLSEFPSTMSVIGSTARADFSPRIFKIDIPAIDCFFSGTGDMFAALAVVRLREAVIRADLGSKKSWISPDDVRAIDLPLARASEKVLGSMHAVLTKTKKARDQELDSMGGPLGVLEKEKDSEKHLALRKTKAAEVRITRCLGDLRQPKFDCEAVAVDEGIGEDNDLKRYQEPTDPRQEANQT